MPSGYERSLMAKITTACSENGLVDIERKEKEEEQEDKENVVLQDISEPPKEGEVEKETVKANLQKSEAPIEDKEAPMENEASISESPKEGTVELETAKVNLHESETPMENEARISESPKEGKVEQGASKVVNVQKSEAPMEDEASVSESPKEEKVEQDLAVVKIVNAQKSEAPIEDKASAKIDVRTESSDLQLPKTHIMVRSEEESEEEEEEKKTDGEDKGQDATDPDPLANVGDYEKQLMAQVYMAWGEDGEVEQFPKDVLQPKEQARGKIITQNESDSPPSTKMASEDKKKDDDGESDSEEKDEAAPPDPLADVSDVFSFAQSPKVKLYIALGLCCAVVSGCVFPAMAWLFSDSFVDLTGSQTNDDFLDNIRNLAFSFMVLGVIVFTSMTLQAALMETAAGEMTELFKKSWFEALLRQDMAYYDIHDVSGTATMLSVNGKKFRKGLGRKLAEGVQFLITCLGGLFFAFWQSWSVSLLLLMVVPFMAVSTAWLLKMNQTQTARANSSYAKAGSIVYTAVSRLRTILALNAVDAIIQQFCDATQEAYEGAASQVLWVGMANGSVMGSFLLSYIPLVLYGGYLLYDQVQETGCDPSGAVPNTTTCDPDGFGVFGALMGVTFAGAVLPQVSSCVEAFVGARSACYPAMKAIHRTTDAPSSDEGEQIVRRGSTAILPKYVIDSSSPDGLKPDSLEGNISFQNVTFAYPTRREVNVFDGLNLEIKAGQTVALCGPSGGGKSTTVQLLERFYDPQSGEILLDNTPLCEYNISWLRQHIGLVSQEPKLFAMSIRDNIKIACPSASQEQIEEAARKANAHDFIAAFEDGYNTFVGDEGTQLSGGQKQRIAIARVLINKPKILLLDEATSALDSESEAVVQDALDHLMEEGNQTILVIAHRLSTIRNADMIAVISGGRVVETGTHASLISKVNGAYFDLVQAQKGKRRSTRNSSLTTTESTMSLSRADSSAAWSEASEGFSTALFSTDGEVEKPSEQALVSRHVLSFDHVKFYYPSRPEQKILRGLDLSVDHGETLALVGPSGQGKSTIIQLIENFYHPTKGSIKYMGVDLKDLNLKWYRSQIGLVSQEPVLFDTTIAENIKFGYPNATQKEIEAAAMEANAHEFISSFPEKYSTLVGSAGSTQVSGGQKQRIAIARALLRRPKLLLLDEATSALDSESESFVQDALDHIMADPNKTTIVIAHRLSTIRNASRIAVINHGRVCELGTHEELMALEGHYHRLQSLQSLDDDAKKKMKAKKLALKDDVSPEESKTQQRPEDDEEAKEHEKDNSKKARALSKGDEAYFFIGTIGAILAGLMFPGWGFVFAFMIELLYKPIFPCEDGVYVPEGFEDCQDYWDFSANEMKDLSLTVTYWLIGIIVAALVGHSLVHFGFGTATERMNKRVRDAAFKSLVRQEVAWFDVRQVGEITTQLSDDAALIHSFSGEPIRTLVMNLSSVAVGLVVSFVFMWPFALLTLGTLPFMAFGAEAEMQMYMGEDEGDATAEEDKHSAGAIVVESLLNIRTVASLSLEESRQNDFSDALQKEDPTPIKTNAIKGSTSGLGQFVQMWGIALMFWWGGFLLDRYPGKWELRDFLISMFSLLFSLSGMGVAMQGVTDKDKARDAADRIFTLIERESEIDPLAETGKKDL